MSKLQYPFKLTNTFFVSLHFDRKPGPSSVKEMQIEIQIKVADKDLPRLQVNILAQTRDEGSLNLKLELVGLFDYVGSNLEQDRNLINDFLQDQGLHMLWPYISQLIRMITGQMGMSPLTINTPLSFNIPLTPSLDESGNS